MAGLEDMEVRGIQEDLVAAMEKSVAQLDRGLEKAVKAAPEIRAEVELMQTAPGVGFLAPQYLHRQRIPSDAGERMHEETASDPPRNGRQWHILRSRLHP